MKRLGWILFGAMLLVNIWLVWFFFFRGEVKEIEHQRNAIMMTEENREVVLGEMRGFLENIQQIQEGILQNNPNKIIKAAKESGRGIEETVPQGLIKSLPLAFKQLGFATHDIFDEIADSASIQYNPRTTQRQVNNALNNCVACHKIYQIKIK